MNEVWMDVHGAGAQRSDPKSGDPDDLIINRMDYSSILDFY
ncbi:hypothetical protein [Methanolobus vulcani]|nr:hypothetical protein [Methanolobus vulcani]